MINPLALADGGVLVTGASAGIGRATAMLLSQLGARVVLVARNPDRLAETLGLLEGAGHRIEPFDLRRTDDLPGWLKKLAGEFGPLRGLVHCAGIQLIRPLRLVTSAEVEELLKINLTAAVMLAKGFRQREVHEPGGSIVFVSSIMGSVGAPGRSAYCASKGALHSLAKSLALECVRD